MGSGIVGSVLLLLLAVVSFSGYLYLNQMETAGRSTSSLRTPQAALIVVAVSLFIVGLMLALKVLGST